MPKYGDTPTAHETDLCKTCIHALFIKGRNLNEEFKRCAIMQKPWPQYAVTACTDYTERTRMTRTEMERVAWIIEVNKKQEFIGFKKPEKKAHDPFFWED